VGVARKRSPEERKLKKKNAKIVKVERLGNVGHRNESKSRPPQRSNKRKGSSRLLRTREAMAIQRPQEVPTPNR